MTTNTGQEPSQEAPLTIEQLQEQLATANKRYTDLQSYHDKTRTGLEAQVNRLRKEATVFTPPKTAEELETFRQENPDWMAVVETVAHDIAANSTAPIQDELNKVRTEKAGAELLAAHPDAVAIWQSEEFKAWATEQGDDVQRWLAEEHDSAGPIRALNFYKAMRGYHAPVEPQTIQEPSAADAVATHGSVVTPKMETTPPTFTRAQIERMSGKEYEANLEAIKEAYSKGLIK